MQSGKKTVRSVADMKEQIHTIPVNEAFASGDECPFCYLQRQTEQRAISYTLGPSASYMELDVRAMTDQEGFCREHLKKMYDYGNALGTALILQTYYIGLMEELSQQLDNYELPQKRSLFRRKQEEPREDTLIPWLRQKLGTCFICSRMEYNMQRYYETFFVMIKEGEFRTLVEHSKGFCMRHFLELMERSGENLPNSQRQWFHQTVFTLMKTHMGRVQGDLDWFAAKFDYRNASADWKNSRDAVGRSIQKLQGACPADPPCKSDDRG